MPSRKGEINVSARIIADISSGIYRTPANALKELISNSFDSNARTVIITTGYPDFDVMTCTDDGEGMTVSRFEEVMSRIGGSDKRATRSETVDLERPIIGKMHACKTRQTKKHGDSKGLRVTIFQPLRKRWNRHFSI